MRKERKRGRERKTEREEGKRREEGGRETEHLKKEDRDTHPRLSGMETQILLTGGGHSNKKTCHLSIT